MNIKNQKNEDSFGISSIVNTLDENSSNPKFPTFDTIYINVLTLVRNNFDKNKKDKEILKSVFKDIEELNYAISRFILMKQDKSNFPLVIYYIPNYKGLAFHKRELSPTKIRIESILDILKKDIKDEYKSFKVDHLRGYLLGVGFSGKLPHNELIEKTKTIHNNLKRENPSFNTNRRVFLISSVPVDYHLCKNFNDFYLLESFTGKIKSKKEFGLKVFKVPYVPFNKYTHIVFGDNYMLKPMAKNKNRELFKELAKKQKWNILTEEQILRAILVTNEIPKEFLRTLNL